MNIWIYSILMGYTIEFNFYVIRFYLQMKLYKKKKFKSDKLEIIYRWMILRKYLMLFSMLLKCFVKKGTFSFNVIKIVLCVKRTTSIYIYIVPQKRSIITLTYICNVGSLFNAHIHFHSRYLFLDSFTRII